LGAKQLPVPVASLVAPLGAALAAAIALFTLNEAWHGTAADHAVVTVPATSLGIILAALSLLLVKPPNGPAARLAGGMLAMVTALLGLAILGRNALDWIGLPSAPWLLAGEEWWNPGPITGAGFTCLGLALLATGASSNDERRWAGLCAAATLVIALTGVIGHLYGASALYGLNRWGGTALSTALALGAVAIGVVFADATRGVAAAFVSASAGGHLLRRLTPAAILAPVVLGWCVLQLLELQQLDAAFGIALLVVSLVVVLVGLAAGQGIVAEGLAEERERLLARERVVRAEVTEILESITDAFFAVDRAWRFTYVNREAERLLRRPRTELLGRNLWKEFPEAVGAHFQEEYQLARSEQRTVQFETHFAALDTWFDVRAYPTSEGLSVYFRDVTQRKIDEARLHDLLESERTARAEAEEQRAQLERVTESRARLMRGFSHDLRNPLGVADSQAWMLEEGGRRGELSDRQRAGIERIRRSIGRSLRLIDDLLELSRAESGEVDVQPVETDVTQVAREAVEDFQVPAVAAGLTLEIHAPHTLAASTDPARVRQILANLLSNAVKYAAKGPVTVEAEHRQDEGPRVGPWIALSVRDSGPGIPREQCEAVFEEFTRLDPHAQPGAGIGLAISRRIARLLGGDLTLASDEGGSSTFTLWLPPSRRDAPSIERA